MRDEEEGLRREGTCKMGLGKRWFGEGWERDIPQFMPPPQSNSCTHMVPSLFPSIFISMFPSMFQSMFTSTFSSMIPSRLKGREGIREGGLKERGRREER